MVFIELSIKTRIFYISKKLFSEKLPLISLDHSNKLNNNFLIYNNNNNNQLGVLLAYFLKNDYDLNLFF